MFKICGICNISFILVNLLVCFVSGTKVTYRVLLVLKAKMNRQTFFKDSQTSLLKTRLWSEVVKVAERIMSDQVQFRLLTSMYSTYENVTKDDISVQLMPCDANPELTPMESYGDGNCLFRSLHLSCLVMKITT